MGGGSGALDRPPRGLGRGFSQSRLNLGQRSGAITSPGLGGGGRRESSVIMTELHCTGWGRVIGIVQQIRLFLPRNTVRSFPLFSPCQKKKRGGGDQTRPETGVSWDGDVTISGEFNGTARLKSVFFCFWPNETISLGTDQMLW